MSLRAQENYLVVGAGFSGAVLARELAERLDCRVTVVESRSHVAGNCHTERDAATGVMVHQYGPHIFNTNRPHVWDYVHRFGVLRPFVNRVKASTSRGIFSLPINLHTINQFFGKKLGSGRGAGVPGIAGGQERRRAAQLRGAGAEIYRARTLRGVLLRLHAQAVGLRAVGVAGVAPETIADPV